MDDILKRERKYVGRLLNVAWMLDQSEPTFLLRRLSIFSMIVLKRAMSQTQKGALSLAIEGPYAPVNQKELKLTIFQLEDNG